MEIARDVARRPSRESPREALLLAVQAAASAYKIDRASSLAALGLIREAPSLRAFQPHRQAEWRGPVADALAGRFSAELDELWVLALAAAAVGALDVALERWGRLDGSTALKALVEEAFTAIAAARLTPADTIPGLPPATI